MEDLWCCCGGHGRLICRREDAKVVPAEVSQTASWATQVPETAHGSHGRIDRVLVLRCIVDTSILSAADLRRRPSIPQFLLRLRLSPSVFHSGQSLSPCVASLPSARPRPASLFPVVSAEILSLPEDHAAVHDASAVTSARASTTFPLRQAPAAHRPRIIAMSDSVDRVFTHALATVRRLPRTGSSRPPPASRLRLYGLYKQSMEGDVSAILPRPTLPSPSSPPPSTSANNNGNGKQPPSSAQRDVHRYASRDLRIREAEAEIEKWDAWHACAGMSRTEAKRRYISTLIETMKEYASGTAESRELVSELEFVWNQIRSQSASSEDDDQDSPSRRLERAGLKQTTSFASIPPGKGPGEGDEGGGGSRTHRDPNRMRLLSPVSQRDSDEVIEGEEVDPDADEDPDARALVPRPPDPRPVSDREWRSRVDAHLRHLSTEIAALREQLSANHLLSSSSFSPDQTSRRRRILYRMWVWLKWLAWAAVRQLLVDAALVLLFVAWGRWNGHQHRRVEAWVARRWNDLSLVLQSIRMRVARFRILR